jgi:hypothetical protein
VSTALIYPSSVQGGDFTNPAGAFAEGGAVAAIAAGKFGSAFVFAPAAQDVIPDGSTLGSAVVRVGVASGELEGRNVYVDNSEDGFIELIDASGHGTSPFAVALNDGLTLDLLRRGVVGAFVALWDDASPATLDYVRIEVEFTPPVDDDPPPVDEPEPGSPEAKAAAIVADSAWHFADNPVKAVSHASTRAAQAQVDGRVGDARFWTRVGLLLVDAATNPNVKAGAVLTDLAARYGRL